MKVRPPKDSQVDANNLVNTLGLIRGLYICIYIYTYIYVYTYIYILFIYIYIYHYSIHGVFIPTDITGGPTAQLGLRSNM